MLATPTPQHHETKVAQLCQNFIRCTVFCIKSTSGLPCFEAVQHNFPVLLSPGHQQAITLPFNFYQLIGQQLLTVYAGVPVRSDTTGVLSFR